MAAAAILEKFQWPYLRNRSSDPLHVWLYGGVFGSNGAIFDSNKYKMAATAILDNFEWPYLRSGSQSTYIARIARSSFIAQLSSSYLFYVGQMSGCYGRERSASVHTSLFRTYNGKTQRTQNLTLLLLQVPDNSASQSYLSSCDAQCLSSLFLNE